MRNDQRKKDLHARIKSLRQWAVCSRIMFFVFLLLSALDYKTEDLREAVWYAWATIACSLFDGVLVYYHRETMKEIYNENENSDEP